MSGESPASVLYSSDGTELTVVNGNVIPTGTRALLISGTDPGGKSRYVPTTVNGALGTTLMSDGYYVQSAAVVSASGSQIVALNFFGTQEIALIVNCGTVTGAGNITYTIQELDPGDGVTTYGNSASTAAISTGNAPGVFTAVMPLTTSPSVKVTWTVSGTFSATIYSTVVSKSTPSTQTINGTITATNQSTGTDGAAALVFDTQVGGVTTTNAPTYVTGNLDALSLTTKGGLRIDGVFPVGAAVPISDAMYVAGAVTTAAPAYSTGQMDPLSLTLSGQLRIDGAYPTATATGSAPDMMNIGGQVTTAAPAYSTTTINALSLTTGGQLRIDGVWATGTTNATAADVMVNGAYVTSAAPTYTTAQINALSMTTGGQLRIDAAYPTATATGSAPDMVNIGGQVTTAAPTYSTTTINALSLTTAGGLRIDGVYPTATATASAPDMAQVGGLATTAAPSYTTGQINPLSLDLNGNLRVTALTNKATTSNVTTVAGATTNTAVLAANANRIFASIYNGTNKNMYVLLNSGAASTSNYSILLLTGSYWELPNDWTGAVNAVWATGVSGNALVTELTP